MLFVNHFRYLSVLKLFYSKIKCWVAAIEYWFKSQKYGESAKHLVSCFFSCLVEFSDIFLKFGKFCFGLFQCFSAAQRLPVEPRPAAAVSEVHVFLNLRRSGGELFVSFHANFLDMLFELWIFISVFLFFFVVCFSRELFWIVVLQYSAESILREWNIWICCSWNIFIIRNFYSLRLKSILKKPCAGNHWNTFSDRNFIKTFKKPLFYSTATGTSPVYNSLIRDIINRIVESQANDQRIFLSFLNYRAIMFDRFKKALESICSGSKLDIVFEIRKIRPLLPSMNWSTPNNITFSGCSDQYVSQTQRHLHAQCREPASISAAVGKYFIKCTGNCRKRHRI